MFTKHINHGGKANYKRDAMCEVVTTKLGI
jgi:hypothetical protein